MDNLIGFVAKMFLLILAYFSPVKEMVNAVLALFMIDFFTGVWKSMVIHRRITSYRLRKSVYKLLSYTMAIISAHILNKSILGETLHLPQLIAGYIGVTELVSILENLSTVTGKDLLHEIGEKVMDVFKNKYLK